MKERAAPKIPIRTIAFSLDDARSLLSRFFSSRWRRPGSSGRQSTWCVALIIRFGTVRGARTGPEDASMRRVDGKLIGSLKNDDDGSMLSTKSKRDQSGGFFSFLSSFLPLSSLTHSSPSLSRPSPSD